MPSSARKKITAGRTYQFDLEGGSSGNGTLPDPFLRLRDSAGTAVTGAFADDGGTGLFSLYSFAIHRALPSFPTRRSSDLSGTGTYKMLATDVTVTGDDYASTTSTTG